MLWEGRQHSDQLQLAGSPLQKELNGHVQQMWSSGIRAASCHFAVPKVPVRTAHQIRQQPVPCVYLTVHIH